MYRSSCQSIGRTVSLYARHSILSTYITLGILDNFYFYGQAERWSRLSCFGLLSVCQHDGQWVCLSFCLSILLFPFINLNNFYFGIRLKNGFFWPIWLSVSLWIRLFMCLYVTLNLYHSDRQWTLWTTFSWTEIMRVLVSLRAWLQYSSTGHSTSLSCPHQLTGHHFSWVLSHAKTARQSADLWTPRSILICWRLVISVK